MLAPADHLALAALYANYAATLDAGDWQRWPDFFTEDCSYRLQPRENFDRGLPLATLAFESQGMLRDLAQSARQLHSGGPRADDDEREPGFATTRVRLTLGQLER